MSSVSEKPNTVPQAMECSYCHVSRKALNRRLPKGWKRQDETVWCARCWSEQYVLRAVTVPVVSPINLTWTELNTALHQMWAATTQASNWMLTELFTRDVRRTTEEKMPPMGPVYLYPEARVRFPVLPSRSIAALEQAVKKKYRARRYDVIWRCDASLSTYRYPTPFPVPNQAWSLTFVNEQPVVSLRVADLRVQMRLKGGPRYHRQLSALRHLDEGQAVPGQLDLYQKGSDLLCKMVAWLPRRRHQSEHGRRGTLLVRTDAHALLTALNTKDEKLWTYHGDHIRRWSAEYSAQLERWSADSKAEFRPHVPFAERRASATRKYHHRMESTCHEAAALIVKYVLRRRFAEVDYQDREQRFCAQFPWARLRELLAEKCDASDIPFTSASSKVAPE
jgi:hypothetical protein